MLATLRGRLILSHVLPLLVILPIVGMTLVYVLETRVVLSSLTAELQDDGTSLAQLTLDQPAIWTDATLAQAFVDRVSSHRAARVSLLDTGGRVLASSLPAAYLAPTLDKSDLLKAFAGEIAVDVDYVRRLRSDVAEAFVPAKTDDQRILGVVRLGYPLGSVEARFRELRYIILGVLGLGLLAGATIGSLLAINIERPLRQVTRAVNGLASGNALEPLAEQGPEEISVLLRAVNTLTTRLRTLEESRRRLLANLVHELGRPLGALHSTVEALLQGADEDAPLRQELLLGMQVELKHLRRLRDDLAELHEQILGPLELRPQPTVLSTWLPLTVSSWREAAQQKGLQWQSAVPDDLPIVDVDPDRLAQAIGNLLSNAIKYTPQGGTISVGADVKDQVVRIWVCDTGPGIPPEERDRIFAPFYRGQQARGLPQGMGLGLAIARDVVVAHGGRLELETPPDGGCRFTILLPLNSR